MKDHTIHFFILPKQKQKGAVMASIKEECLQLKKQMIKNHEKLLKQITKNYKELEECIQKHCGK